MARFSTFPPSKLPMRPKPQSASVAVHRLPTNDGVIIKVTPPKEPVPAVEAPSGPETTAVRKPVAVPCDIVLVIDVSGSMGEDAPVPGESNESNGLSVLDLVKHASRTILQTLGSDARLGIVEFSSSASVVQRLLPMTDENKKKTNANIGSMYTRDATNLWQGMLLGMDLAKDMVDSDRVPAIMVLTDGQSNHMNPPQGFVPKLRTLGKLPAPIHTFGFGYSLQSGLLKSIAEFTGGNYNFIPDAGMIGTVFVHAVANLQSTFANTATLRLTVPSGVELKQTMGIVIDAPKPKNVAPEHAPPAQELVLPVGSIQYGQSRDIYVQYALTGSAAARDSNTAVVLNAVLEYQQMSREVHQATAQCRLTDGDLDVDSDFVEVSLPQAKPAPPALSASEIAFHVSRSALCAHLSTIFPLLPDDEHVRVEWSKELAEGVAALAARLPAGAAEHAGDAQCAALMADIKGQVHMAVSTSPFYYRWGHHYLPSLQSAHSSQQCNSFKDAGPLLYGAASPLFIACRDALDTAFDTLPPPEPTARRWPTSFHAPGAVPTRSKLVSMAAYRSSSGPCFASFCRATLADGRRVRVNRLRRGMRVQTPRGPRAVVAVLKTPVSSAPMVSVGRLLITPWHPISHDGTRWVFPCQDGASSAALGKPPVRYTGAIYSVLLQPDSDADAHALSIEGIWVVSLGHGMTTADVRDGAIVEEAHEEETGEMEENLDKDVRVHPFFGNYEAVCRSLAAMDMRKDGLVVNGGSTRSNWRLWHSRK